MLLWLEYGSQSLDGSVAVYRQNNRPSDMPTCLIGLGSNLGDRAHHLDSALARLSSDSAIRLVAKSQFLDSSPIGGPAGQANYVNAVAKLETDFEPQRLAALLWQTETQLGRRPAERWGPRLIDLDLLLHGHSIIDSADLTVPHPRMVTRQFVLKPAVEIAPEMVHPTSGWSIRALEQHLREAAHYVALTGPVGVGKSTLARSLGGVGPRGWHYRRGKRPSTGGVLSRSRAIGLGNGDPTAR